MDEKSSLGKQTFLIMNFEFIKPKTISIISSHLGIATTELLTYYSDFELINKLKQEKSDDGFLLIPKMQNSQFIHLETTDNWSKSTLIGVDLPIEVKAKIDTAETVMVLGIDPLRKRKDFPSSDIGKVIVGTPYALHSSFYRESKGRTKIYGEFVESLTQKYNCYITDIYKIWMNNATKSESDKFLLSKEKRICRELLFKEIDLIKPIKIIAFGNLAFNIIRSLKEFINKEIQVIKLPHPSGANRKWNYLLSGNQPFEEKLNYLLAQIC